MESHRGADGAALPWDVEFGFVAGELQLFQIRPLVERGQGRADRVVARMLPAVPAQTEPVALGEAPHSGDGERP